MIHQERQLTNHTLANFALPPCRTLEAIRVRLVVAQRLVYLLLCVEHKRAVLDDFLVERKAGHEDCMMVSTFTLRV